MKIKLLIIALFPILFLGCDMNDLFSEGDTRASYDGPTVLGFFPLEQESRLADAQTSLEVQLIGPQQTSDLSVAYSVDDANTTAVAGTHYTISSSSPVTLSSGTSTVDIVIDLIGGSLAEGEEVVLILTLEGADDVEPSENLDSATIFIQG